MSLIKIYILAVVWINFIINLIMLLFENKIESNGWEGEEVESAFGYVWTIFWHSLIPVLNVATVGTLIVMCLKTKEEMMRWASFL